MSAIAAINLSKTYKQLFKPPVEALHNVSFSINEGEMVGLIGPNGAGKSTLMRLLLGFLPSDSGEVTLFNEHPESLHARSQIGYQADTQFRAKNVTVKSFLLLHARLIGIERPEEHIEQLLKTFELFDAYKRPLASLSKGMRQKLELVLAFLGSPKLVFLDEPTAALDPPSVFVLRDFLAEKKKTGITVLFSSHHLTEVESICDRIIFISDGTVVDDSPMKNIGPGHLEQLFRKNLGMKGTMS
ncbi:MAG: ABC transporter ATP-binding protein [Bacteroidota bacterium]